MNVHDSENIKALLEEMSFSETDSMEDADLIILNTCAIRENAHNKVFGFLGRVKHLKETKPDIITGICGCMAQEENVVSEIKNKYKWVDIVFGTHNLSELPRILNDSIKNNKQEIEVLSIIMLASSNSSVEVKPNDSNLAAISSLSCTFI